MIRLVRKQTILAFLDRHESILRMKTNIDDYTLALLLAFSYLMGRGDSTGHVISMWERATKEVQKYRQNQGRFDTPRS
jgi:hypothetical protein